MAVKGPCSIGCVCHRRWVPPVRRGGRHRSGPEIAGHGPEGCSRAWAALGHTVTHGDPRTDIEAALALASSLIARGVTPTLTPRYSGPRPPGVR